MWVVTRGLCAQKMKQENVLYVDGLFPHKGVAGMAEDR